MQDYGVDGFKFDGGSVGGYQSLNIQNGEQGVILRILSDVKPTEDSVTVVPSLEDYYLYVFGDIL